jgi:hypothetical protein
MNRTGLIWLCGLSLIAAGCGEPTGTTTEAPVPVAKPIESPEDSQPAAEGTVSTAPTERQFAGIAVTIPAGWEERPVASEFIQAEYSLSGPAGPARLTMSSAGGGLEANLDRWRGQFMRLPDDPAASQITIPVGSAEAVVLELHGTFRDGFSGGDPKNGWCMLGAAIPTGPSNFFVKLTGPRDTVLARRDELHELVRTARLSQ